MALRYFGSKGWFKEKLDELLPADTEILVAPFLGSGKAELYLANKDLNSPFWAAISSNP